MPGQAQTDVPRRSKASLARVLVDPATVYQYCNELFSTSTADDCFPESRSAGFAETYGNALFDIWLTRRASLDERLTHLAATRDASIWRLAAEVEDAAFRKTASLEPLLHKMRELCLSPRMRMFVDSAQVSADMQAGRWSSVERILKRQREADVLRGELFGWARTQLLLRSKDIAGAQRFVDKMRLQHLDSPFATLLAARVAIATGQTGHMDKARTIYAESHDPSVMLEYGLTLLRSGNAADERIGTSNIDNALISMRLRADATLGTVLYLLRHKQSALASLLLWRLEGQGNWPTAKNAFTDYQTVAAWTAALEGDYPRAKVSLQRTLSAAPMDCEGNWLQYLVCKKVQDVECQIVSLRNLFTVAGPDVEVLDAIADASRQYPENKALKTLKQDVEKTS
jgi:hypothetical protein